MSEIIRISLSELEEQNEQLKAAEELVEPKAEVMEPWGEAEVLNRYLENYGKLSLLIEQYVSLLQEDITYIYEAAGTLVETEGKLLS